MEKEKKVWAKMDGKTVFSTFNRMFGEHVTSARFQNMINETMIKVPLYNLFTRMV